MSLQLIESYYQRFNAQDIEGFLALLSEDVVHDISQGGSEVGKSAFRAFLHKMNRCYREQVSELVIMASPDGARFAAEFWLDGHYLESDEGLPVARGQRYRLRVGAFFEVRAGQVTRISNHYNLNDWLRQVQA